MDLLHLVFTFNLVTALFILAGCFYLHMKYDDAITTKDTTDSREYSKSGAMNAAGIVGALVAVSLMSGVATLFV